KRIGEKEPAASKRESRGGARGRFLRLTSVDQHRLDNTMERTTYGRGLFLLNALIAGSSRRANRITCPARSRRVKDDKEASPVAVDRGWVGGVGILCRRCERPSGNHFASERCRYARYREGSHAGCGGHLGARSASASGSVYRRCRLVGTGCSSRDRQSG